MKYRADKTAYLLVCSVILSWSLVQVERAQGRETLSLDGTWNFATDPNDRGENEKWYSPSVKLPAMPLPGYAPTAKGRIRVPGIWDNQGYGVETAKVHHNFVGKGWYRREVKIPKAWKGKKIFLAITGVNRYAKAWINENYLGEHIGCVSAFEWDITQYAAFGGSVTVTIQVDSKQRWEIDCLFGAFSLADYMDVAWGGIWGHVFLETRTDCWLSDLFVQPDVSNSSCSVSATLNGKTGLHDEVKLEIFDKKDHCVAMEVMKPDTSVVTGKAINMKAKMPGVKLWTPDTPVLYQARLSLLKNGKNLDEVDTRFGMRQFSSKGPYLFLNGKRLMLCGYGDDHIYTEQMAMPSDKNLHLSRLRVIKSYGFNHVRHHSTMLPPEYYEACDEIGIITTAEFPIVYRPFMPGYETWKRHVKPDTDPGPAMETYRREWEAAIKRHRNHPSILCWVRGNELYSEPLMRDDFYHIAKQFDPGRWYVDTDGIKILPQTAERETAPLYFVQFSEWADPVDNAAKYETSSPGRPVISHETANYVTFSRSDLVDQFKHNFKPFWLTAGKEKLQKLGLYREADQWADKSERLYALLHKCNLELLRKNPLISGYHWWLFQDYWTSSNGLVDHYFRPKTITREEVRTFNNDVVLLQDGLGRTYRGGNQMQVKVLVSNFSMRPLHGEMVWEVVVGGRSFAHKKLPLQNVPQGELVDAAEINLELPETKSPAQLKIMVKLVTDSKRFSNSWSSWLYPAVIRPRAFPIPVFAESKIKEFGDWNISPIPTNGVLSDHAVYLTDSLFDSRVVNAVDRGACGVVFLGKEEGILMSLPVTFKTTWWKAGDVPDKNHCGTYVYDHPLTRAMAPDGWCDAGWFDLLEGSCKYVLERIPARPNVIIRAVPSMALIEDDALLFEVGVGKGSLIVSGLNHQRAGGRPENQWLLARLLEHATALPHPGTSWPASFLTFKQTAPDGCLPGYRRLVVNEGEYGTWHSYREDQARIYICRQTKPGNRVTWETVPLPKESGSNRVVYAFAGGLGFISEPKTEGFVLEINGKETLRFDLPEPRTWESADKRVSLRFEPRRSGADHLGLFYVTIPRDMLKSGESCQLSVRSIGKGSRRWFGLNPYISVR
ncbi:MAG: glycoside hydrolase family 2 TIM barrel-domain containing protein [Kiritimatiellae bacterium]|nr:glycoside hydrolase family 2 TIM barrel-domain containing protein [Kiritimatiellia bacterium]